MIVPVAKAQLGCVLTLAVGAAGVNGCALITTLPLAPEVQPAAFVTV